MERKVITAAQYFRDQEIGSHKESLEGWLAGFLWAKKFGEYQSGGDNTSIYIEDGIAYVKFLGGGTPEEIPLDDLIFTVQSRLEALGVNPQSVDDNQARLKREQIDSNPALALFQSITETRELMMYLSLRLRKTLPAKVVEVVSHLNNRGGIPHTRFFLSITDSEGNLVRWVSSLVFLDEWRISASVAALGKDWIKPRGILSLSSFESSDLADVISHLSALPEKVEASILSKPFLHWFSPEN